MDFYGKTVDNQPAADWPAIQRQAAKYGMFRISVAKTSEAERASLQQMRWVNGVLIPYLCDKTGYSRNWWKMHLKLNCGQDLFTVNEYNMDGEILHSISHENDLTPKQHSRWMEAILDYLPEIGFGEITPPDPELRK